MGEVGFEPNTRIKGDQNDDILHAKGFDNSNKSIVVTIE